MKKALIFFITSASFAVNAQKGVLPTELVSETLSTRTQVELGESMTKTLLCVDTIRYPQAKEQILGTSNFYTFGIWQSDNESISQVFLNSGNISISGIEFYGANDATNGTASVTVQAAIYNVDGNNIPTTLIASGSTTFTSTTAGYKYVTFTPVTVSGNYAVVLTPTNAGGVYSSYVSDAALGQPYDEDFTRFRSIYYPQSGGVYVSIPVLSNDAVNFPSVSNFEPLVAPIVSYSINTDFTAVTSPACLGTPVVFTSTTTPSYVFTNRMLNYQEFNSHFGGAVSDSTFVYDMDDATLVWSANHSYTYASAGSYDPILYTLGGFWNSCVDFNSHNVVVNPIDDASFSYTSNTFCNSGSNETPTVNLAGGTFSSTPAGLVMVSPSTGEIDLSASADGTYSVTYQTAGSCPNSSMSNITITSAPDASFTYNQSAYCSGDTDPLPIFGGGASGGTFSSTAGLVINASNGTIDLSASTAGSYTVTNSIPASGSCPAASETFDIVVNTTPTAIVSGGGQLCGSGSIPVNIALTGTAPWDVTYFDGTNTVVLTGQTVSPIVIDATVNGTYNVTSVSSSGCTSVGTGSASVTFNDNPVVTLDALSDMCINHSPLTLSGGLPAGGTYSGTGVSAGIFNPSVSGAGTFTITYSYTDVNGCSGSSDETITVDPCLSLSELENLNILIAPNPSNDYVSISFEGVDDVEYKMISEDGKVVIASKVISAGSVETFSVAHLANGVYFVELQTGKGIVTRKIVVQ